MANQKAESAYTEAANDEMENMYLNFSIGDEIYGIEIRHVLQIIGMQEINGMPDMPSYMRGFIILRGNVIPVVSIRALFGKEEEGYTDRTCIIVVQVGEKEIGLIVDAIRETLSIEPGNISPPPGTGASDVSPYIMGIAQLEDGSTAVLIHLQKLFTG